LGMSMPRRRHAISRLTQEKLPFIDNACMQSKWFDVSIFHLSVAIRKEGFLPLEIDLSERNGTSNSIPLKVTIRLGWILSNSSQSSVNMSPSLSPAIRIGESPSS